MKITYDKLRADKYADFRYDLMVHGEGFKLHAYKDTVGIPTIGIGFAIKDNVKLISEEILGKGLPDSLISTISSVAHKTFKSNSAVEDAFSAAIKKWNDSHSGKDYSRDFSFDSDRQVRRVFDALVEKYEDRLDARLDKLSHADLSIGNSEERAVLFSMVWNTAAVIGPKLVSALERGDRAEAWFEIRYDSNGGASRSPGLANRRYEEAYWFELYNDPKKVDFEEASDVATMYTEHRNEILKYEHDFSIKAAIKDKGIKFKDIYQELDRTIDAYEDKYDIVAKAEYQEVIIATKSNVNIDGDGTKYDSTKNENDILIGNSSNNRLDGGDGVDYMNGGKGRDVYVLDDAFDQVVDPDVGSVKTSVSLSRAIKNITEYANTSAGLTMKFDVSSKLLGNSGDALSLNGSTGKDTYKLTLDAGSYTILLKTGKGEDYVSFLPGEHPTSGMKAVFVEDTSPSDRFDFRSFHAADANAVDYDYTAGEYYYILPTKETAGFFALYYGEGSGDDVNLTPVVGMQSASSFSLFSILV